ncbi:MAG: BON domain-containing protein, partial [Bacteroidota bacterium]
MKSDIQIREDVLEEIRWDPQLTKIAPQIGVSVKDEVVTLTGIVDYYYQRLAAENAAQRIAGVKVVAV